MPVRFPIVSKRPWIMTAALGAGALAAILAPLAGLHASEPCNAQDAQIAKLQQRVAELEQTLGHSLAPPSGIESCGAAPSDMSSVPSGFKCRTSKGWVFEKVDMAHFGEAWKGPDGVVWSGTIGRFDNLGKARKWQVLDSEAVRRCSRIGGRLPTASDFRSGEAFGFREVLPGMRDGQERAYWSSSVFPPEDPDMDPTHIPEAMYFVAYNGVLDVSPRLMPISVRCVKKNE